MICFFCKKRHIILITCKCNQSFCIKHNAPEDHECAVINELYKLELVEPPKKIDKI
jgi:hypothetical protein